MRVASAGHRRRVPPPEDLAGHRLRLLQDSATLNDYLYPGSTLLGSVPGFPLIDNRKWNEELLPKLGSNNAAYPNANFTSDYKYVEDITNAYASAHYAWDRLLLIGGLRYDHTRFDAYSPFSDDGGTPIPPPSARRRWLQQPAALVERDVQAERGPAPALLGQPHAGPADAEQHRPGHQHQLWR
jgi:outer membrane receptor protein involved in Fe transport